MSFIPVPIDISAVLEHTRWHAYAEVASMTLVLYDYSLTFNEELRLIWGWHAKSWITVLFVINRYLPIIAQCVNLYSHISQNVSYSKFALSIWLLGTSVAQLIITDGIVWLRVSALYGHAKKVRYPLLALFLTVMTCSVFVLGVVAKHTKGAINLAPGLNFKACLVYTRYHDLWTFWIPILVYETTTLFLVSLKFYGYLNNTIDWSSNLLELVIGDTLLYLAAIFVLFIGNAVLFSNPDPSLSSLLTPITLVTLSIFGNRMLLNLREEGMQSLDGTTEATRMETLVFASSEAPVQDGV